MFGQLWVVDEPEPVDGFDVAAGAGEAALLAASAGPARASAAPAETPITGSAARSQSFRLGRIRSHLLFPGLTALKGLRLRSWTASMKKALESPVNYLGPDPGLAIS